MLFCTSIATIGALTNAYDSNAVHTTNATTPTAKLAKKYMNNPVGRRFSGCCHFVRSPSYGIDISTIQSLVTL